jgi:hypothetical protein
MKRNLFAAFGGALLVCLGCSAPSTPDACTTEFRFGLTVLVKDAVTGDPIGSGASLVARDGAFKDSVAAPSGRPDLNAFPLATAGERAGNYQLSVTHPGYLPWSRSNVQVTRTAGHVNPVAVTALLQPIN